MPIMNGLKFHKKLRETPRFKDLPFLFVSGYDDEFTRGAVKACQNSGFMQKGRPMEELLNWIRFLVTPASQRTGYSPNDRTLLGIEREAPNHILQSREKLYDGLRILIVDDDQDALSTLAKCLSSEGFTVRTLTDAEEAIIAVQCTSFDLVLLDFQMPDVDGLTALGFIKEYAPRTRVIMLTSQDGDERIEQARKLGAEGAVDKLGIDQDLPKTIKQFLRKEYSGSPSQ